MKNKKILSIILIFCLLLSTLGVFVFADEGVPDGYASWDEYFNSLIYSGESEEVTVPEFSQMENVAENEKYKMLYHADGFDFYIVSKSTGKIWSSAIHPDYMDLSKMSSDKYSSLINVSVVDEAGTIKTLSLVDKNSSDFSVSRTTIDNGVALNISLINEQISFEADIQLDKDGFTFNIPQKSLREEGETKLMSLEALPLFGATKVGEEGYIFYPDGSGALIDLYDYEKSTPTTYSYSLYGLSNPNFNDYNDKLEQNIKNIMLPCFGIKQSQGGFFAAIISGDTTANLNMTIDNCHKVWYKFDYRMYASAEFNYTGSAFGGGTIDKLLPQLIKGDRKLKYFLLEGEKSTYSDMANAYREFLVENKILTKNKDNKINLSLEFFMAATTNGILGDSIQVMTTYNQVNNILKELKDSGVNNITAVLNGWASGGYEQKPTAAGFESSLGGSSDYKKLSEYAKEQSFDLNLAVDYLLGDSTKGKFNQKKEVIRGLLGGAVTDKQERMFFINPLSRLSNSVDKMINSKIDTSLTLMNIGEILLPSLYEKEVINRQQIATEYQKVLKKISKSQENVSVFGGNYYVLPYADYIYDIPDSDSGYYQNSQSVPFYQMLLHGFVEYSSVAGNLSENLQFQKLKWIETGSIPYFCITEESPNKLKDTGYNQLFSSEFSLWKEKLTGVYKEFNEKLSGIYNGVIIEHTTIKDNLVRVTFDNGKTIYINYANNNQVIDDLEIPAMDYVVIGG